MAGNPTNLHMTIFICVLLFAIGTQAASAALTQALCSNDNTGADSPVVTDPYQSNGRCFDNCKANYAYAVVQDTNCWCSNFAPAETVDVGSCSKECPGYGFENCGSLSDGLFGYVALNKRPSGTMGASTSSSIPISTTPTSTPLLATTQPIVSAQPTPTETPAAVSTSTPTSTSLTTPSTSSTSTTLKPAAAETISSSTYTSETESPTSTWSPTPMPTTITVSGAVSVITVTPTAPPAQTAVAQIKSSNGGFLDNKPAVAGVFAALGIVVAALLAFAIWMFLRRRRHAGSIPVGSVAGGDTPQRRPSRLSQMGLVGSTTHSSVHGLHTAGLRTSHHGEASADITPVSPRASYPRMVDQRLDPDSLWEPLARNNGSHASLHSFQDNRDYSRRVLHIANPDS